jgi:spore maturation protein CgeB
MLILYVAMKYDYGKPAQGFSFEHANFYDSLRHMGHDLVYFDFMTLLHKRGRRRMNRRLMEVARAEKPALLFSVLFGEQLDKNVLRQISRSGTTVTLNWFCDDHFRFEDFSRHWAPCFNWVVTTSTGAIPKYAAIGYTNVIKSQWACNPWLYRKLDLPLKYDITFVGQPHSNRPRIIRRLRQAGFDVRAWGTGWESGRLTEEQMIAVFNQSRINLNLSDSTVPVSVPRGIIPRVARALNRPRAVAARCWRALVGPPKPGSADDPDEVGEPLQYHRQIKGRNFEVPGCGAFLLSGRAENLDEYYDIGRELVCFEGETELLELARYYLEHEPKRAAIARAGYERTRREHTYAHRFRQIFRVIGLAGDAGASLGQTLRID